MMDAKDTPAWGQITKGWESLQDSAQLFPAHLIKLETFDEIKTVIENGGMVFTGYNIIHGFIIKDGKTHFLAKDRYGVDCYIIDGQVYYPNGGTSNERTD